MIKFILFLIMFFSFGSFSQAMRHDVGLRRSQLEEELNREFARRGVHVEHNGAFYVLKDSQNDDSPLRIEEKKGLSGEAQKADQAVVIRNKELIRQLFPEIDLNTLKEQILRHDSKGGGVISLRVLADSIARVKEAKEAKEAKAENALLPTMQALLALPAPSSEANLSPHLLSSTGDLFQIDSRRATEEVGLGALSKKFKIYTKSQRVPIWNEHETPSESYAAQHTMLMDSILNEGNMPNVAAWKSEYPYADYGFIPNRSRKDILNDLTKEFDAVKGKDHKFVNNYFENSHNFIQLLFPQLNSTDSMTQAPGLSLSDVVKFRNSSDLKAKTLRALDIVLPYYGIRMHKINTKDDDLKTIEFALDEPMSTYAKSIFRNEGNHNFRRITRILDHLSLIGLDSVARQLLMCFIRIADQYSSNKSLQDSLKYWKDLKDYAFLPENEARMSSNPAVWINGGLKVQLDTFSTGAFDKKKILSDHAMVIDGETATWNITQQIKLDKKNQSWNAKFKGLPEGPLTPAEIAKYEETPPEYHARLDRIGKVIAQKMNSDQTLQYLAIQELSKQAQSILTNALAPYSLVCGNKQEQCWVTRTGAVSTPLPKLDFDTLSPLRSHVTLVNNVGLCSVHRRFGATLKETCEAIRSLRTHLSGKTVLAGDFNIAATALETDPTCVSVLQGCVVQTTPAEVAWSGGNYGAHNLRNVDLVIKCQPWGG